MLTVTRFDGKNIEASTLDRINPRSKDRYWIDINAITAEDAKELAAHITIHPLTVEDMMTSFTRIKVEEYPDYLFCVFYYIDEAGKQCEIDLLLNDKVIISNTAGSFQASEELKKNAVKLNALFKRGHEFIFHYLLDGAVDSFFTEIEKINDHIEDIESHITDHPCHAYLSRILETKRQIVPFMRLAMQQREKLSYLSKKTMLISEQVLPYLRDVYDHSIRVYDSLDNAREYITNTFDVYLSATSNSLNEVMKTLSIIATIVLPMSVISSIYGTNFVNLPGKEEPLGFFFMLFIMILFCIIMLYLFRKKGWF